MDPLALHLASQRSHWGALPRSPALYAGAACAGIIIGMGGDLRGMLTAVACFPVAIGAVFAWTNQAETSRARGPDETEGRSMPESPAFWIGAGIGFLAAAVAAWEPWMSISGAIVGTILGGVGLRGWVRLRRTA